MCSSDLWVRVEGFERVFPVADEDLERENDEKTSSVHFVRFELDAAMKNALRAGAKLTLGVDHPAYAEQVDAGPAVSGALFRDLDS